MVVCFFSFMGWENVSSIAEEVKHPEYAFRKAIPWAIVSVGGLYTLVAWVYLSVAPANLKVGDPTVLSPILRAVFGDNTAIIGNLVAIILLVLATNAWVLGASRQVFSLARNKVIPETFAHLSPHSKIPTYALLFLAVGYGFVTICIAQAGWAEEGLIKLANANFILIYFIAFFAALRVFTSKPMKWCAWLAMMATISFVPFLEWIIFMPICFTCIFYIWLKYFPHTSMQTSLNRKTE